MEQSENISELVIALSKAQGQIVPALKDSTNPHFKSKYADLSSVWEACRDPLSKNGLAVIQTTRIENDKLILVTTLAHSSGQWIKSFLPVLCAKQDAQGQGSGLTYARRYGLSAIVGVAPDDDDGNAASTPNSKQVRTEPKKFEAPIKKEIITTEQFEILNDTIGENHEYRKEFMKILNENGIMNLQDLPLHLFERAMLKAKSANYEAVA